MAVKLKYVGEAEHNNTKGLIFEADFSGDYGTAGVGDLLNLTPSQNGGADGGITDPNFAYNLILEQPPKIYAVLNQNINGYQVAIKPNANPTLTNFGLLMFGSGGVELTTGQAYDATVKAGSVLLEFFVPLQ